MKILFLSDNFPPEVNAPASRTFDHCKEWVGAGHQVTVITCAPNFPNGKVLSGYRNRIWQKSVIDGIVVIRVWSYITANEGFIKRILDYVSYMCSATLASLFVRKVDVVVGTSPQFFTVCAAYMVASFKRVPWIFELRDIWPESIRAVGAMKNSFVLDFLEKIELFLYKKSSAIISVTNSFREILAGRGVDVAKVHVVTNGVDITRFYPRPKSVGLLERHGLEGKFVTGYIGTHGMAHGLETVLAAASRMKAVQGGEVFRFLLLGDGARKAALVDKARSEGLDNVIFVDTVTKEEVTGYWSILDVSIIHLKKSPLFTTVIPSKMFECMGMSIPILHGVKGESASIIENEQVGITFEPENVDELCAGLWSLYNDREMYERFKQNGPLASKHYDRTYLAGRMLGILECIFKERNKRSVSG